MLKAPADNLELERNEGGKLVYRGEEYLAVVGLDCLLLEEDRELPIDCLFYYELYCENDSSGQARILQGLSESSLIAYFFEDLVILQAE